jgi:hypothetical protein
LAEARPRLGFKVAVQVARLVAHRIRNLIEGTAERQILS